jgi:hypothetical protein
VVYRPHIPLVPIETTDEIGPNLTNAYTYIDVFDGCMAFTEYLQAQKERTSTSPDQQIAIFFLDGCRVSLVT